MHTTLSTLSRRALVLDTLEKLRARLLDTSDSSSAGATALHVVTYVEKKLKLHVITDEEQWAFAVDNLRAAIGPVAWDKLAEEVKVAFSPAQLAVPIPVHTGCKVMIDGNGFIFILPCYR